MLQFKGSWEVPLPGAADGNTSHKSPSIYNSTDSKGDGQMSKSKERLFSIFLVFPH